MKNKNHFWALLLVSSPIFLACALVDQVSTSPPTPTPVEVYPLDPSTATPTAELELKDSPLAVLNARTEVRSGPGPDFPASHSLPAGTTVPILGWDQTGSWLAVPGPGDGPGAIGWIPAAEVTVMGRGGSFADIPNTPPALDLPLVEDPGSPPTNTCVALRLGQFPMPDVHLGPGRQFALIARLGNWAEVLKTESGWHMIFLGPGRVGWVNGDEVDLSGPCGDTP